MLIVLLVARLDSIRQDVQVQVKGRALVVLLLVALGITDQVV